MAASKKTDKADEGIKPICRNKRAYHDYALADSLECGIVLTGTEVKSLREGSASLEDAYAKLEDGEVWLIGSDIPEYTMGNRLNHKPKRKRKLLLHRAEIDKLLGKTRDKGLTVIPTRMYLKGGRIKCELAVARGKKLHDKRAAERERETQAEARAAMNRRRV